MRSRILLLAAALGLCALPVAASAYKPDAKLFPAKAERYGQDLTERYLGLWQEVGPERAGANLVIKGAPKARVRESADRMERWLNPLAPAPVEVSDPGNYEAPAAPAAPASSGGCPANMAGEADSPTDVNPSSGAAGCFQVIPSTRAAMGAACADVNAPSCLAAICAAQGNDAWVAANPC